MEAGSGPGAPGDIRQVLCHNEQSANDLLYHVQHAVAALHKRRRMWHSRSPSWERDSAAASATAAAIAAAEGVTLLQSRPNA